MKILGLDLGANSLGWSLIDTEAEQIIDMGVRIFPAGVDNLGQGEKETSKNATRAGAFRMRLQLDRKQQRRKDLVKWLTNNLYWPQTPAEQKQFKELDPYRLRAEALERPMTNVELARILLHLVKRRGYLSNGKDTEAGSLYEGSPKTGMIGANDSNWEELGFKSYGQYLYKLESQGNKTIKKRSRYTFRKWYAQEFDLIWETQAAHHPTLLTNENRAIVEGQIIFYQRKLKLQTELRGACKFVPTEKRTTKADPLFQQFAIYQQLNNLEFQHSIYRQAKIRFQELPDAKRLKIIDKLYKSDKVALEDIKKLVLPIRLEYVEDGKPQGIDIRDPEELTSNYDQQKALAGAPFIKFTYSALSKIVAKKDLTDYFHVAQEAKILFDQLDQGVEGFIAWFETKYPEAAEGQALAFFSKAPAPKGTSSLSRAAIEQLMQFMPVGKRYDEAITEAGFESHNLYERRIGNKITYQKSIAFEVDRRKGSLTKNCILIEGTAVRNPIVSTCLFELARVVNSVIKHYGNPDRIRLELAREAAMTPDDRNEYIKKQKENEAKNAKAQEHIMQDVGIPFASKSQIIKYKLWKEQGGKCIYSGLSIGVKDIFGANANVDVDHIIPQGATGGSDDSYMNKVLCFASENRDKGMRLPLEWLNQHRSIKLREIVGSFPNGYPDGKKERLFCPSMAELPDKYKGFSTRQLNDTRAATRTAMNVLRAVVKDNGPDGVLNVNGKLTHSLRNDWFPGKNKDGRNYPFIYNEILDKADLLPSEWAGDKSRLDHRHHALDALVVALSTRRDTQLANKPNVRRAVPWGKENLQQQAKEHLERIIVSYKITNKPNQALHNETLYGKIKVPPGQRVLDNVAQGSLVSTVRKDLSKLTKGEITEIVDNQVRDCVFAAIKAKHSGWQPGQDLPKDWHKDLEVVHKNKLPIKKVRIAINSPSHVQIRAKGNRDEEDKHKDGTWVAPEGNHHAVVYKNLDTGKQRGEIIQYLETAKRLNKKEPVIQPVALPNEEVLMSLQANELVCFDVKGLSNEMLRNKRFYKELLYKVYRVQKLDRGEVRVILKSGLISKLELDTTKKLKDQNVGRKIVGLSLINGVKLKADPAGFLYLAHG